MVLFLCPHHLGTIGFGGPVGLVGYMQRDLVERHRWIDDEEDTLGLALAQIMPGPLAAPRAMAIGCFAVLFVVTALAQAERAEVVLRAGLLGRLVQAPPRWLRSRLPTCGLCANRLPGVALAAAAAVAASQNGSWEILPFFTTAGAFGFGRGLAVAPFPDAGVVVGAGWLSEQQCLAAGAVAMIAPGPVVITVAFLGDLVAGPPGATLSVVAAPWFVRHRSDAQLRAVADGATAAASGASAGAVVVLGQRAIVDIPPAAVAAAILAILWRCKIPEPILVLAAGGLGLVLWPSVR